MEYILTSKNERCSIMCRVLPTDAWNLSHSDVDRGRVPWLSLPIIARGILLQQPTEEDGHVGPNLPCLRPRWRRDCMTSASQISSVANVRGSHGKVKWLVSLRHLHLAGTPEATKKGRSVAGRTISRSSRVESVNTCTSLYVGIHRISNRAASSPFYFFPTGAAMVASYHNTAEAAR